MSPMKQMISTSEGNCPVPPVLALVLVTRMCLVCENPLNCILKCIFSLLYFSKKFLKVGKIKFIILSTFTALDIIGSFCVTTLVS